tara:strand:- start:797 stop:1069 length:273 start_codon:yes stop_codon:yes gene_type:complete
MSDPLDIPLTADDIQDMDPVMVANLWAKHRESRQDLLEQRRVLQEAISGQCTRIEILLRDNTRLGNKVQRYSKALAKVALRSIEKGGRYK